MLVRNKFYFHLTWFNQDFISLQRYTILLQYHSSPLLTYFPQIYPLFVLASHTAWSGKQWSTEQSGMWSVYPLGLVSTSHSSLYTVYTVHCVYCILHCIYCTVNTVQFTLYTVHCIQYAAFWNFTLCSKQG